MSLGPMELMLILGLALLLFGPSRLPGLGKSLGDAIRGFKKGIEGDDKDQEPEVRRDQISESDPATATKVHAKEKDKA